MAGIVVNFISPTTHNSELPSSFRDPFWYAAYTSSNRENSVAEQLARRSVEHFLPVYQAVHQWKDRRVRLNLPLFPGYVFVRIALRDRLQVLQIPGVANLVGFNGTPAPLPQEQIDTLRTGLACGACAEPHPYLAVGHRVFVKTGPFAGMEGFLVRRKNRKRFVISLDSILRSLAVEVDELGLVLSG